MKRRFDERLPVNVMRDECLRDFTSDISIQLKLKGTASDTSDLPITLYSKRKSCS